eukprot:gb/GECG01012160.1/.p1 GENE.gb/GECG01012160.1/~~gb/GECG01012160.1/.p1  ORF type:complete len:369 (+),score=21.05 gb/GECG01012160.1/:1-1107(+)
MHTMAFIRRLVSLGGSRGIYRVQSIHTSGIICHNERQKEFQEKVLHPQRDHKADTVAPGDKGEYSCEFYYSPDSKLVRTFSWLLSAKALGAGLASGVLWQREGAKLYDIYVAAEESMLPFQTFLDTTTLPLPDFRMPCILVGLAGLGLFQIRRSVHRVCTRLTRRISSEDGNEYIDVEHMTMLGRRTRTYLREDCDCAKPKKLTTHFVTISRDGTKYYYLLPVEGWKSEDKDYLKRFIYEHYFRDETPPPNDEELIQVEGFGPYRPMQFADPSHPASQQIGWPASKKALEGTALFVKDGHVYTEFSTSQRKSIDQKREDELAKSITGDKELNEALQSRRRLKGQPSNQVGTNRSNNSKPKSHDQDDNT